MSIDKQIAMIPEGWRLHSVDMSIEGRANVLLRPPAGSDASWVNAAAPTLLGAILTARLLVENSYRGWTISQGRWPEPAWMAIGPNYDASWEGEEDGFVDNGEKADAPTREALIAEIDAWFEENEA